MPGSSSRFPDQRWQLATPQPERAAYLSQVLHLNSLVSQVLLNRGITTPEAAQVFLNPELQILPSPLVEFEDLPIAMELLLRAIADRQFIAICGDYDADGMTSTALLLRALRFLGATVDYAIPSRMQEGYGINHRIVEEFAQEGVGLILTVDNGIAAQEPIARARELGMAVIVTDHHDIPPTLPPANAILNPKLIREDSPYRGAAGVGVAYILAVCLAQSLQKTQDLTTPLIELFTLGTIADLAPLTGVNRRWVKRGLKLLPKSRIAGVQALIQVAGLGSEKALKPEAIGFRLGPRINAIGRISDPQIVIELLTTDDDGRALELAMKCEQVNQLRQRLCELIEQDAIAWCQETGFNPKQARVLVIVQPDWHHGVIGIVASRLVERYGVPVFIGTYEEVEEIEEVEEVKQTDEAATKSFARIRGSARSIPEFNVFEALQFCGDVLERFGGHRAAGGFTLAADQLEAFQARLQQFAQQSLQPEHLKPLVTVDVQANFRDLTLEMFERLDVLHPCGIENPDPVFWTANVHIVEQRTIGRDQAHLKLTLSQVDDPSISIRAVAWRWGEYYPLADRLDVAYRLRLNDWNGVQSVELELVGARPTVDSQYDSSNYSPNHSSNRFANDGASRNFSILESELESEQPEQLPDQTVEQGSEQSPELRSQQRQTEPIAAVPIFQLSEQSRFLPSLFQSVDSDMAAADRAFAAPEAEPNQAVESLQDQLIDGIAEELACFDINSFFNFNQSLHQIEFYYGKRKYAGSVYQNGVGKELRISNAEGQLLIVQPERRKGFLGQAGQAIEEIDVSQPHYFNLVRSALTALELAEKQQLIQQQQEIIELKEQEIDRLNQQLERLQHQLSELKRQQHQQIAAKKIQTIETRLQTEFTQEPVSENTFEDASGDESNSSTDILFTSPVDEKVNKEVNKVVDSSTTAEPIDQQTEAPNLQEVFSQLSASPLPAPVPAAAKSSDPKQRLKAELGEQVCSRLDSRSQKDLVAAYKKLIALETESITAQDADAWVDYSDVGLRLCSVIEREVIQPFFKEIHQFLLANQEPCTLGGIALRARKKYTLGMLPPLLASEWQSFQDDALTNDFPPVEDELYISVGAQHVSADDRNTVQVFLDQWQHPLSIWLQNSTAASTLAQIDKLLTIAADAENLLYEWQFEQLRSMILGNPQQLGVLQLIHQLSIK